MDHQDVRSLLPEILIIDTPTDRWFIDGSEGKLRAVRTAGVNAADPTIRQAAVDTINRLVAPGRTTFARIVE